LVYFVQARTLRLIKIGVAVTFAARLKALQTGSPDKLDVLGVISCEDPAGLEKELHRRFRRHREHGEWFRPGADLVAHIQAAALTPEEDHRRRVELIAERIHVDRRSALASDGRDVSARRTSRPRNGRKAILAAYKASRGIG